MASIDSDDSQVAEMLDVLQRAVTTAGGVVSPNAVIRARQGKLSVHATEAATPGETLVGIPEMLLPDLSNVELARDDDKLVLATPDPAMLATQQAVLEKLLDLYNALGKLAAWRAAWPFAALAADEALLDRLLARSPGSADEQRLRAGAALGEDAALVRSFLNTRVIELRRPRSDGAVATPLTLAPLLDCIDHDVFGAVVGFGQPDPDSQGFVVAQLACPHSASPACHIRYRFLDALESYLHYGFVDEEAPGVLAVAGELALPGDRRLVVGRDLSGLYGGTVPDGIPDVQMARVSYRDGATAAVDRVLIPGPRATAKAPAALRGFLSWVLGPLARGGEGEPEGALVRAAEEKLVAATQDFYDEVGSALTAAQNTPPAHAPAGRAAAVAAVARLHERQRALLAGYARQAGMRFATA